MIGSTLEAACTHQEQQSLRVFDTSSRRALDDDLNAARDTFSDLGIYLNDERMLKNVVHDGSAHACSQELLSDEEKTRRRPWIGRRSWPDVIVPIQVIADHDYSAFEFDNDNSAEFIRLHSEEGVEAFNHISEYISKVFAHQQRTHVYLLYIHHNKARILYSDRAGTIVSKWFLYGARNHPDLHRFIWRLANMSNAERGLDPTAKFASDDEIKKMRTYAFSSIPTPYIRDCIFRALCWDAQAHQTKPNHWPVFKLTVGKSKLLVGRPAFVSQSLVGRCTRGYVAYDLETNEVCFLKDCWRTDHPSVYREHEIYARLSAAEVPHTTTCQYGGDVTRRKTVQRTTTQNCAARKIRGRIHYRLRIKEVCRPLTDFTNFWQLTCIILHALNGEQIEQCLRN